MEADLSSQTTSAIIGCAITTAKCLGKRLIDTVYKTTSTAANTVFEEVERSKKRRRVNKAKPLVQFLIDVVDQQTISSSHRKLLQSLLQIIQHDTNEQKHIIDNAQFIYKGIIYSANSNDECSLLIIERLCSYAASAINAVHSPKPLQQFLQEYIGLQSISQHCQDLLRSLLDIIQDPTTSINKCNVERVYNSCIQEGSVHDLVIIEQLCHLLPSSLSTEDISLASTSNKNNIGSSLVEYKLAVSSGEDGNEYSNNNKVGIENSQQGGLDIDHNGFTSCFGLLSDTSYPISTNTNNDEGESHAMEDADDDIRHGNVQSNNNQVGNAHQQERGSVVVDSFTSCFHSLLETSYSITTVGNNNEGESWVLGVDDAHVGEIDTVEVQSTLVDSRTSTNTTREKQGLSSPVVPPPPVPESPAVGNTEVVELEDESGDSVAKDEHFQSSNDVVDLGDESDGDSVVAADVLFKFPLNVSMLGVNEAASGLKELGGGYLGMDPLVVNGLVGNIDMASVSARFGEGAGIMAQLLGCTAKNKNTIALNATFQLLKGRPDILCDNSSTEQE